MIKINESLSFDNMVELYDETRIFDEKCLYSALDFLAERFPPMEYRKVFEPGIGTGRISIALAQKGYQVTGIDISEKMLTVLKDRIDNQPLDISFQVADVTESPFSNGTFDIVIAVHLFYFIKNWKKAVNEIIRVIKDDCPIILMHTGTGTEIPFLNERYKELCAENGYQIGQLGVKSTKDIIDHFELFGYNIEWIRDRWKWTSSINLNKAVSYLNNRAYSFTSFTPNAIHSKVISLLKSECINKFGSLDIDIEVPSQIYFAIISH